LSTLAWIVASGLAMSAIAWVGLLSALTILSADFDLAFLLSFAAGNFIYIAASDLIPEVKHARLLRDNLIHFGAFVAGMGVILLTRTLIHA